MAEVLGPIGLCFGCLSFLLSTVPTAAKALEDFSQCVENFRLYEARLVRCKAKADKWNIYWRQESDFGEHESIVEDVRNDMIMLCKAIKHEIESNITDEREQKSWRDIGHSIRLGRFRKLRPAERTTSFVRSVGFVLFRKAVIESWLIRFETAMGCIEELSEHVFAYRTADHFGKSPSRDNITETRELEEFIRGLTSLAQILHDECTVTAAGTKPTTYGWGLGLRPPTTPAISVENWKFIAEVHIELRFSKMHGSEGVQHLHLDVPFHKDNYQTHLGPGQVRQLICEVISSDPPSTKVPMYCSTQHPQAQRTRPIGDLLKDSPDLLRGKAWKQDRANLVQGISHWALLLWDTAWMERLCCYGLQIEKGVTGHDCIVQIFNLGECPTHNICHHGSRLRNLGLIISQLILGSPLRRLSNDEAKEYQQWRENDWRTIYRSDIIAQVFVRTTSAPLCDAVSFCLKNESALATEPFQPGFLYECIDHIYKP
ncbi:hypothetical protein IQ06DRAFT_231128 [Phaeosphaeriaceae sp. SRC1lsM3a]|nr:hypothetical protein IQ06DRAFT_231128 [Stagonospora sp. SRC1lsM3a]